MFPKRTRQSPPLLLDSRAAAFRLSVCTKTLWRLVKAGEVAQPLRLSRQMARWRAADLPPPPVAPACPADETVLLDAREVSRRLSMSVTSLRRMVRGGRFPPPALRSGRKLLRWRRHDVEAWVAERAAEAVAKAAAAAAAAAEAEARAWAGAGI